MLQYTGDGYLAVPLEQLEEVQELAATVEVSLRLQSLKCSLNAVVASKTDDDLMSRICISRPLRRRLRTSKRE